MYFINSLEIFLNRFNSRVYNNKNLANSCLQLFINCEFTIVNFNMFTFVTWKFKFIPSYFKKLYIIISTQI